MSEFVRQLLTASDMSADVTSDAVAIELYPYYAVQASWTGSPTGTLVVQASVDRTNWATVTGSSTSLSGSSGSALIDYVGSGVRYVRLKYTYSSGTGSLSAVLFAKSGG